MVVLPRERCSEGSAQKGPGPLFYLEQSRLGPCTFLRLSYNTPPCEALMPYSEAHRGFTIRPHRRFPVFFPVTYHAGLTPPPL